MPKLRVDNDELTPPQEVREWASLIPNLQIAFIEEAGHLSNLEKPSVFNTLLSDFLGSIEGVS